MLVKHGLRPLHHQSCLPMALNEVYPLDVLKNNLMKPSIPPFHPQKFTLYSLLFAFKLDLQCQLFPVPGFGIIPIHKNFTAVQIRERGNETRPNIPGNSGSWDLDGKHYSLFKQRVKDNERLQCQGIWRHHMWSYEHHRHAYNVVHLCLHLGMLSLQSRCCSLYY